MLIPQDHLSISETHSIKEILSPLSKLGDIHYFHYGVNYPDSSGFSLTTNLEYLETWYRHQFPHCGFHLSNGWHLWNSTLPKQQIEIAQNLGIEHGIHFVCHQKEKTEVFGFASNADNNQIYDFYLNHLYLLKRFSQYFLEEAKELIQRAQTQLIIPPPEMILNDKAPKALTASSCLDYFLKKIDYPFNLLSERESVCFSMLVKGFSNTEMSKKLNLSSKTVDVYINRIKQKLKCASKNEVITKARAAGVIEYYLTEYEIE